MLVVHNPIFIKTSQPWKQITTQITWLLLSLPQKTQIGRDKTEETHVRFLKKCLNDRSRLQDCLLHTPTGNLLLLAAFCHSIQLWLQALSVHLHGYHSLHPLAPPLPSWTQLTQLCTQGPCEMVWAATCILHSYFPTFLPPIETSVLLASLYPLKYTKILDAMPDHELSWIWCQTCMWHSNTFCTISHYKRVHPPVPQPCMKSLSHLPTMKQMPGKHHGEPYLPLQHKPSIP